MNDVVYSYIGGDPLEDRHSYTYTAFQGEAFLEAWRASRDRFATEQIAAVGPVAPPPFAPSNNVVETVDLLGYVASGLRSSEPSSDVLRWRNWVLKRFEVSKRLHASYLLVGESVKADGNYRNLELYLSFGECMAIGHSKHNHLPSLNALHKCLDTLCSLADNLETHARARLARLITEERNSVDRLGMPNRHNDKASPAALGSGGSKNISQAVVVLADTLRSRGYAQVIAHAGLKVGAVVIVEALEGPSRWGQSNEPPAPDTSLGGGYFVPDLRIPLKETCRTLTNDVRIFRTGTVNDGAVVEAVAELRPELVVFSGFGGEIVKENFLNAAGKVLHMHAGWLPDYRGSTTIYYSILRSGRCGVSAILLNSEIDEGAILCRKTYPMPPSGMDIDYLYDSLIRSDTLLEVLSYLQRNGSLPDGVAQNADSGETYYIIHPVLKHLAILSMAVAGSPSH